MIVMRWAKTDRAVILLRVPEFALGFTMFLFGCQLTHAGERFATAPIYSVMHKMACGSLWSRIALALACARLVALIFNGFFPVVRRITPSLRGLTSLLSCFVWAAAGVGVYMSNPIAPGVAAFMGLGFFDMLYATLIAVEIGHTAGCSRACKP